MANKTPDAMDVEELVEMLEDEEFFFDEDSPSFLRIKKWLETALPINARFKVGDLVRDDGVIARVLSISRYLGEPNYQMQVVGYAPCYVDDLHSWYADNQTFWCAEHCGMTKEDDDG